MSLWGEITGQPQTAGFLGMSGDSDFSNILSESNDAGGFGIESGSGDWSGLLSPVINTSNWGSLTGGNNLMETLAKSAGAVAEGMPTGGGAQRIQPGRLRTPSAAPTGLLNFYNRQPIFKAPVSRMGLLSMPQFRARS